MGGWVGFTYLVEEGVDAHGHVAPVEDGRGWAEPAWVVAALVVGGEGFVQVGLLARGLFIFV